MNPLSIVKYITDNHTKYNWEDIHGLIELPVEGRGRLVDGKKEGLWVLNLLPFVPYITYTEYSNGKINGLMLRITTNGFLLAFATFKDNKRNGPLVTYHSTGIIERYYDYVSDEIIGWMFWFDPTNKITQAAKFSKHKLEDEFDVYEITEKNLKSDIPRFVELRKQLEKVKQVDMKVKKLADILVKK